jgi:hypothetical protein
MVSGPAGLKIDSQMKLCSCLPGSSVHLPFLEKSAAQLPSPSVRRISPRPVAPGGGFASGLEAAAFHLKHFRPDLDNAAICNSQVARGRKREVEHAATNEWAAVGNANDD